MAENKQFGNSEQLDDTISRQAAISHVDDVPYIKEHPNVGLLWKAWIESLPSAQPETHEERTETHGVCLDVIDRQATLDWLKNEWNGMITSLFDEIKSLPSAQPEQRYTEEELRVFAHGISLSLLSKRSSQHWQYDKDTATEIEFLERLYDKVSADMKGGQG